MSKKYLYIEIAGGLGNQIFIYQMARYLNSIHERKSYINKYYIDYKHSNGQSTLEDFKLENNLRIIHLNRFFSSVINRLKPIFNYINKFNQNLVMVLNDSNQYFTPKNVYSLLRIREPKFLLVFE